MNVEGLQGTITIDKIEVHLEFYIYDILDFDLLLGLPLEKLLASHGYLEEMMHTSPFISSKPVLLRVLESSEEYDSEDSLHSYEDEQSSSSLIEFEPLPAGQEYVVLDLNRESTSSFHNASLEIENQWAMESCEAPTLESEEKDSTNEHGSFTFDIP